MASRIMHYCIANEVGEKINCKKDRFILGGIAPDIHTLMDEPKAESHFIKYMQNETKVAYNDFAFKYTKEMNDSFYLGYYCHLISDDIWLDTIFSNYIKPLSKTKREKVLPKYYSDFRVLNKKLISYFGLVNEFNLHKDVKIEEINIDFLEEQVQLVRKDFENQIHSKDRLELFNFSEILEYIELSIKKSIKEIEKLNGIQERG